MLPAISADIVADMRAYFHDKPVRDPYRDEVGPQSHVACFPDRIVAHAPHAFDIANDPKTIAAVSHVLGCKPTIAQMGAWWSLACDTPAEHAELWHRDVDDYRFLKLFVFLTDVDEKTGPHAFVRGSHKRPELTKAGVRIPDDVVRETFGEENIMSFTGKAGTTFLENTYGIHKGTPLQSGRRLLFQVLYGQRPNVYSPARGFGIQSNHDPFTNRLFL